MSIMMLLSPLDGVWRVNNKSSLAWWMWEVTGPFVFSLSLEPRQPSILWQAKSARMVETELAHIHPFKPPIGGNQSIQHKWRCSTRVANSEQSKPLNIEKATQNIDQEKNRPANLKFNSTSTFSKTFGRIQWDCNRQQQSLFFTSRKQWEQSSFHIIGPGNKNKTSEKCNRRKR